MYGNYFPQKIPPGNQTPSIPDTHTSSHIYADTDSKRNTDRESNRNAYSCGYANHNAYCDAHTHSGPMASPPRVRFLRLT